jgi:PST family polysaccharide transporter
MNQPRRSLTHQTLSGLLWTFYGKGAYALLQMAILAILARLVSPTDFGVVSAALIVIGLSTIMSQVGLAPALVQREALERRHIDTAFLASLLLGLGLGLAIWVAAPLAAGFFRIEGVTPVLRALAWLFPLQGLATVAESLVKRELRFRWLANVDVISYGAGYGLVGIPAALLGWGVWALVAGQLAHNAFKTGLLLYGKPPHLRGRPDLGALRDLMYFGGGFTVAKIANQVAQQGDYLVVGRFLGATQLGYYGRAYNLMSAPASGIGTILDAVLFPVMARVQNESHRLAAAYRRGIALITLVVLPPSVVLVLLAPEVVHVVLGPRWSPMIVPFQILGAGMLFRTSSKLGDSLTRATGAVYRRAWRQIVYAVLVVGGAVIGQRWGIAGVAWFVLGALAVNFLLMAQLSLSEAAMSWSELWRAQLPAAWLALATALPVWGLATALRHWSVMPLMTLIGGGALMLACALPLAYAFPRAFLGADGLWMLDMMRGYARKLAGGDAKAPLSVEGTA